MDMSPVLLDPELGYTSFTVQRTSYRRQNGASVPATEVLPASGTIQLLPEEDRREEFIAVYTGFPLRLGENNGGAAYTVPDRILWNGETWRVVKVRSWEMFGYYQGLAIRVCE